MSTPSLVLCLSSNFLLVPLSCSSSSNIYHIHLHTFQYSLWFIDTSNFLSPTLSSSIFFHVQLPVHHDVTRLSPLSLPYLSTYTLSLSSTLDPSLSPIHHLSDFLLLPSLFLLPLSLSLCLFLLPFLSFITSSGPFTITSIIPCIDYSFINFWFSLSFSIPIFQSGLLLSLSAFSILTSGTYFKLKSNLEKYNAYLACL